MISVQRSNPRWRRSGRTVMQLICTCVSVEGSGVWGSVLRLSGTFCISSCLRCDPHFITVTWNHEISSATVSAGSLAFPHGNRKAKVASPLVWGWLQPASSEPSTYPTVSCFCKQRMPPTELRIIQDGEKRGESQELLNFTFRGRSHDIQPRLEVSYFFTLLWTAGLGTCQHSGGSYIRASFFPGI